ncbi:hypothetical protein LshimejAT787_0411230 [Lyophyllum shimeji]|uniref:Uncharacterized protein n=1 Tax=Lyophyllum shimeji TaxID=47721 RepID=A0A9P3PML5_LYOSH|nr:hypothetical protein LshimejAT787_0411230 [Lyophyllum shimeji]
MYRVPYSNNVHTSRPYTSTSRDESKIDERGRDSPQSNGSRHFLRRPLNLLPLLESLRARPTLLCTYPTVLRHEPDAQDNEQPYEEEYDYVAGSYAEDDVSWYRESSRTKGTHHRSLGSRG